MGETTGIAWCDHAFSPWRGCTKVSPGCDNCYAEAWSKRNPVQLGVWGDDGTRVVAADQYWRAPLRWDRLAADAGVRRRVFCASLADVFEDRPELDLPRERLFELIRTTPALDWLLLTKRPENARILLADRGPLARSVHEADVLDAIENPSDLRAHVYERTIDGFIDYRWPLPNVWLGVTAENQEQADERIPILLDTPAAVRFVSYEPALGPVKFTFQINDDWQLDALRGEAVTSIDGSTAPGGRLDWVIVGGESGPHARPFDIQWARDTVTQCQAAGVPVFVKQLGRHPYYSDGIALGGRQNRIYMHQEHKKGGDVSEWPADLRVQEFPR